MTESQGVAPTADYIAHFAALRPTDIAIIDEGREIDALLLDPRDGDIADWPRSKRRFLEAITVLIAAETGDGAGNERKNESAVPSLIEPLSDREKKILNLIAAGSTNSAISTTLFISLNTVKWHLKNIFAKLGVGNRTSAVAVARQLDLIP